MYIGYIAIKKKFWKNTIYIESKKFYCNALFTILKMEFFIFTIMFIQFKSQKNLSWNFKKWKDIQKVLKL